jgi:hypothetical protein
MQLNRFEHAFLTTVLVSWFLIFIFAGSLYVFVTADGNNPSYVGALIIAGSTMMTFVVEMVWYYLYKN